VHVIRFADRSFRQGLAALCIALAVAAPAAQARKPFAVTAPSPSGIALEVPASPEAGTVVLVDARSGEELEFSKGVLPAPLVIDGAPLQPMEFLAAHVQAELASRGVPMDFAETGDAPPRITLKTFRVRNHRSSAYSPFVTFTYLAADVETAEGTRRIAVFVKRGKVPVWSFKEIVEPTFNQPLSVAVKEFAAKVVDALYGYRSSDATVDALITAAVEGKGDERYLDVYALGFSNSARAVPALVQLAGEKDEYVRLAAISSLGNLRATEQFDFLKSIYQSDAIWQDRAMALKAIGDLGTDEAKAYLAEVSSTLETVVEDKDSAWTLALLRLYE
jgi:hypothetical protein